MLCKSLALRCIIVDLMKSLLYVLLTFFLFVLNSCTDAKQKTVIGQSLDYDSISIALDYPYLGFYYGSSSIYANDNDVFWAGYNHLAHSIDIVSLTERQVVESIALESEGPNAIYYNKVGSFVFNDSLIVFKDFSNTLTFYSRNQKSVCKKIALFESDENWSVHYIGVLPGQFSNSYGMKMYDNMLVLPVYSKTKPSMSDVLTTSVNIENNEIKHLDIVYPKEMDGDIGNYGSLTYPCLSLSSDRVVYNFPYSSRIYSYMLESGDTESLFMESSMTSNRSEAKSNMEARDFRKHFDYEDMSLRFCEAFYDKYSDSYIRVHHDKKSSFDEDGKSYLMIYDCKTETSIEYSLPSSFYTRYYVADGFIYFLLNNNQDDYLHFSAINIKTLLKS